MIDTIVAGASLLLAIVFLVVLARTSNELHRVKRELSESERGRAVLADESLSLSKRVSRRAQA